MAETRHIKVSLYKIPGNQGFCGERDQLTHNRMKGEVEKELCGLADANAEKLEVWIVRPSGIMSADAGFMMKAIGRLYDSIDVNLLARDMIHILSEGHRDRIIESEALLAMGKK